jgi:hypothetical protein
VILPRRLLETVRGSRTNLFQWARGRRFERMAEMGTYDGDDEEFDENEYLAQVWVHLKAEGCDCQPDLKLAEDPSGETVLVIDHQDGCHMNWAATPTGAETQ